MYLLVISLQWVRCDYACKWAQRLNKERDRLENIARPFYLNKHTLGITQNDLHLRDVVTCGSPLALMCVVVVVVRVFFDFRVPMVVVVCCFLYDAECFQQDAELWRKDNVATSDVVWVLPLLVSRRYRTNRLHRKVYVVANRIWLMFFTGWCWMKIYNR